MTIKKQFTEINDKFLRKFFVDFFDSLRTIHSNLPEDETIQSSFTKIVKAVLQFSLEMSKYHEQKEREINENTRAFRKIN